MTIIGSGSTRPGRWSSRSASRPRSPTSSSGRCSRKDSGRSPTSSRDDRSCPHRHPHLRRRAAMVESARPTPDARLDVLDGLRGLAILIVLWYHVWEWSWLGTDFNAFGKHLSFQFAVETGFTGVDLFFFISGLVLFYPYARHMFEGKKLQTVKEFAYRRFIKIVPS